MILFHVPSTFILSGASGSGKTTWLQTLIKHKNKMFDSPPTRILYFYGIWQPLFEDMEKDGVEFFQGLPSQDIENSEGEHCMVILDDLQQQAVNSEFVEKLFTQGSHHKNLSVFYLTQNLFRQGKNARNIALNAHYVICFRNPRDVGQMASFGRQLGKTELLKEAYADATSKPYGYLVVDLNPHSDEAYRFRTDIWPNEDTLVYQCC